MHEMALRGSHYFDLSEGETRPSARRRFDLVKKILRIGIIAGCSCYCFYFLCISVIGYLRFETSVAINVKIMRQLADILPGITVCTPSLTSLKNLNSYPDIRVIEGRADLAPDQKHRLIHSLIRQEIEVRFGSNVSLQQFFDRKKRLSTSDQLISSILCDRMTWKRKGKYAKYSLPHICDNVFKIRSVDREAGVCFTLFHRSALHALTIGDRFGVDDIEKEDPEEVDLVNLGSHAPPMFVDNGLLQMTLNYNLQPFRYANQSTDLSQPYGGKFWIHPNRQIPHMSETGYRLFPGKLYTIYLTKDIFHLMEKPYSTACRNYSDEYYSQVGPRNPLDLSIPMSRDACIDECIVRKARTEDSCRCWPPAIPFTRDNQTKDDMRFCDGEKQEFCYSEFYEFCFSSCPADCLQEAYEVLIKTINDTRLEHLPYKQNMSSSKGQRILHQYLNEKRAVIDVVFLTNEETHHVHGAKINFVEMSVDVAGLFGLFLAFSFVYFIDLFEYVRGVVRANKRVAVM